MYPQEVLDSYKFVGNKLMELGYCSSFAFNETNCAFVVTLTERGNNFRRELVRIHEAISNDNLGTQDLRESAMIGIVLDAPHSGAGFFGKPY